MNSTYRIYSTTVKGQTPDGGILECNNGCNGTTHASWFETLYYDEAGGVEMGVHLISVTKGPCDNSCTNTDHGFFVHPRELII